jgi:hypothetical protein
MEDLYKNFLLNWFQIQFQEFMKYIYTLVVHDGSAFNPLIVVCSLFIAITTIRFILDKITLGLWRWIEWGAGSMIYILIFFVVYVILCS